ncbi:hypothetical protein C7G41_28215 [Bradyrhizobium sp. MOS002]|nr:hypothetical protein C7G41_28215 [Bradyrhizobium sp. MOS002]
METRHCEELLRRSNPDCFHGDSLDCFASLAMTSGGSVGTATRVACGRFNDVSARDKPALDELNGLSQSPRRGSDGRLTDKRARKEPSHDRLRPGPASHDPRATLV